jgi:hypothetical protein
VFTDLSPYDEIEPIPAIPKRPKFGPVWLTWLAYAATDFALSNITHGWSNLMWLLYFAGVGRMIHRTFRDEHKFMADLAGWEDRANAHHDTMMRQLQNYANRDWN